MANPTGQQRDDQAIVLVTGPSGAGRTTAINALEDFGFEAIDNLPLSLFERLLSGDPPSRPIAIGVDPRTRDFSADGVRAALDLIAGTAGLTGQLVFVDCSVDVLLRRFSETRRRHPLARDESPRIGVEREKEMLEDLSARADVLIDTSDMSPHDLRADLRRWFAPRNGIELTVGVHSFAFKRGVPRDLDMIMDLRFLRNPHWVENLRALTGRDQAVAAYVRDDPLYEPFLEKLTDITTTLLPAYKAEGKSYFTIGLGCTGGRHRSVFVAETFAKGLADKGWQVSIRHRELDHAPGVGAHDQGQV